MQRRLVVRMASMAHRQRNTLPPTLHANPPRGPHDLRIGGRGRYRVLGRRLEREVGVGVDRKAPPPLEVHVVPQLLDVAVRVAFLGRVLLHHLLRGGFDT